MFAPKWDYDFRGVNDGNTRHYRGGERYHRPCGKERKALKALGRFPGGNKWLTDNINGWVNAYHGTHPVNADSI
eukprot:UN27754